MAMNTSGMRAKRYAQEMCLTSTACSVWEGSYQTGYSTVVAGDFDRTSIYPESERELWPVCHAVVTTTLDHALRDNGSRGFLVDREHSDVPVALVCEEAQEAEAGEQEYAEEER